MSQDVHVWNSLFYRRFYERKIAEIKEIEELNPDNDSYYHGVDLSDVLAIVTCKVETSLLFYLFNGAYEYLLTVII